MHYYNGRNSNEVSRARSKPVARRAPLAIHTGLSVTVAGYLIALERDEYNQVAKVIVHPLGEGPPIGTIEIEAISVAAKLLAERARRVLGRQWKVVEYKPKRSN